jgi:hypothetical protein
MTIIARRNYAMKKMKPNNRQNSEENEDEIDIGILIFLTFPLRLEAIDSCLTLKIGFKY